MAAAAFKVTFIVKWDEWSKQAGYPICTKIKFPKRIPDIKRTGLFIDHENQWDDSKKRVVKHPNHVLMNKLLLDKETELTKVLLEHMVAGRVLTKATLKRKEITSFFDYMASVVSAKKAKTEQGRILEYFKREPSIHEIDIEWCRHYHNHQKNIWENEPETIKTTFKVLRRVTNQAQQEGYIPKIIIGKGAYPCPKGGSEIPEFLLQDEREILFNALVAGEITDPSLYKTLTYYMLACYSGLRFGDLEQFDVKKRIIGDMIVLRASKNGKNICFPIGESLKAILAIIRKIGPLDQSYDLYNNQNLKTLQAYFKEKHGIDKPWGRSHIGRHSFGRFMAEQKVSEDHCAHFMGVSKEVVKIYYHVTGNLIVEQNKQLRVA